MSDDPPIQVPKLPVLQIIRDARDLEAAYRGLADLTVDAVVRRRIVDSVVYSYDDERLRHGLDQTVRQLDGRPLGLRAARRLAWQIAARTDELLKGPIVWFDSPSANGWVALEVMGIQAAEWKDGSDAVNLRLFCLTGTPAGFEVIKKVPTRWLRAPAYGIGWSRRTPYPDDPRMFVGLRFWAYLVTRTGGELDLQSWATDRKLLKANQTIIRARQRFDTEDPICHLGFDHDCWDCTKGIHECTATFVRGDPEGPPGSPDLQPDPADDTDD